MQIDKYRYEIDETNAVYIYENDNDVPFLYQPHHPDTTPWTDRQDAENWTINYINSFVNPVIETPTVEDIEVK